MSAPPPGRLEFEFNFGKSHGEVRRDPDAPLTILVLADFSGRSHRGVCESLTSRQIRGVDCDNFDRILAEIGPSLKLPLAFAPGGLLSLQFESLDQFHPDQLLKRASPLSELVTARRLLQSPTTAGQGTQELERLLGRPAMPQEPSTQAPAAPESVEATMARLLGGAPRPPAPPTAPKAGSGLDVQALIKNLIGSVNTTPSVPAGQSAVTAAAELELSTRLRALLHHAEFQALEAAWRSLNFLVQRLPDEERVKVRVLDVSLDELSADPDGLLRLLRDQAPQLIVGNYTFGATSADVATLRRLAALCAGLGIAFVAGAQAQLVGCDSFARQPDPDDWKHPLPADVIEAWQLLRASPEAKHVALAAPRFLLRQPYGAASDPIETFTFEEIPVPTDHEAFLWGNPAFLCACVLVDACVDAGEEAGFSGSGEIGELPVFRLTEEGERTMKPCAEAWLVDRAIQQITGSGLVALQSHKNRDAIRIVDISSIAQPRSPLAGLGIAG
jgi:type VI secretion system protein ImpC